MMFSFQPGADIFLKHSLKQAWGHSIVYEKSEEHGVKK